MIYELHKILLKNQFTANKKEILVEKRRKLFVVPTLNPRDGTEVAPVLVYWILSVIGPPPPPSPLTPALPPHPRPPPSPRPPTQRILYPNLAELIAP